MDTTHHNAIIGSGPDLFSSLCGLTLFVTNSEGLLTIEKGSSPAEVSVLSSLITSGSEVEHLMISEELPPDTGAQLGSAIKSCATIATLALGRRYGFYNTPAPELLQMLTVSANPTLEQLTMRNLGVSAEEYRSLLCDPFGKLLGLRSLELMILDSASCCPASLFSAGIEKLRQLESLSLERIWFPDEEAETLMETLKDLPLLTELQLCQGNIMTKTAKSIGRLVSLGRIRRLILEGSRLNDERTSAMVDAIVSSPGHDRCGLEELKLSWNEIGSAGGQKLAGKLIPSSPRLRVLDLSENLIGETAAAIMGRSFQKHAARSLSELNVSDCNLGPSGIEALLGAALPALSTIRIGGNAAEDVGARAVARLILNSCGRTVAVLQAWRNGITEAGAVELARVFSKAYALQHIDLTKNLLGPHGGSAILDALATASTISMDMIRLIDCGIGDDGASAAGRLIERRGCRHAFLDENEIHGGGAKAIADSVAVSPCMIEMLVISTNPLGEEGVEYLLDKIAAQKGRRLVREMQIVGIKIGVKGAMAARRAVEQQDAIYQLHASRLTGDEEADRIMDGVENWERDSKPAGTATLVLW